MKTAAKKPEITVEEVSIVMLGDFNPKIFHPVWFAKEDLLRQSEAEDAKIEVVHQDVTAFSTEWLNVQVLRERFTAAVKADVYSSHLADLVRGVFQKLRHTPVRQMGINLEQRARFKNEEDWHAFGHFILPKSPWKGVAVRPGLRVAQMQGQRSDDKQGLVLVIVTPDLKTKSDVVVRVNDHYELAEANQSLQGSSWAATIIEREFNNSIARASATVDQLIVNFLDNDTVDEG